MQNMCLNFDFEALQFLDTTIYAQHQNELLFSMIFFCGTLYDNL